MNDRPIIAVEDDEFDVNDRVVKKTIDIINENKGNNLTIAISGEWGVGKTSCINLLCNEINKEENIILIKFDPFSLGSSDVPNIINIFYLSLYSKMKSKGSQKIKKALKKSITSLALLARSKISIKAQVSDLFQLGLDYDLSKNIDDVLGEWKKNKPGELSDYMQEISRELISIKKQVIIIIDDLDRLPASHIFNLLIFLRLMDKIDNLISIISLDYKQTVLKFLTEKDFEFDSYFQVQNYLDKFFQIKLHIHQNRFRKYEYAIERMKEIDKNNIFSFFLSDDYNEKLDFQRLIDFLSTPRQINKWIIALKYYYQIIKCSASHKRDVLYFIAATIKYPIIMDYLCQHALQFIEIKDLTRYISRVYNIDFTGSSRNVIILASLGVSINIDNQQEKITQLQRALNIESIEGDVPSDYLLDIINKSPNTLSFIVGGYVSENEISIFSNFLDDNINDSLSLLLGKNNSKNDSLAYELADYLRRGDVSVNGKPDIKILNNIWIKKAVKYFSSPYETIVLYSLSNTSLEEVIEHSCLSLSEAKIHSMLYVFGIKNNNGVYDLSKFNGNPTQDYLKKTGLHGVTFDGVGIKSFDIETIKLIIKSWLDKVDIRMSKSMPEVIKEPKFMGVFYRYIQWGSIFGIDNRTKLSRHVSSYLAENKVQEGFLLKGLEDTINTNREFNSKSKEDLIDELFGKSPVISNYLDAL